VQWDSLLSLSLSLSHLRHVLGRHVARRTTVADAVHGARASLGSRGAATRTHSLRGSVRVRSKRHHQRERSSGVVSRKLKGRTRAPVSSSADGAPLRHRSREDGLAHPADTQITNLAPALALLSRWRLFKHSRQEHLRPDRSTNVPSSACVHGVQRRE
jgi:hypothetical protein